MMRPNRYLRDRAMRMRRTSPYMRRDSGSRMMYGMHERKMHDEREPHTYYPEVVEKETHEFEHPEYDERPYDYRRSHKREEGYGREDGRRSTRRRDGEYWYDYPHDYPYDYRDSDINEEYEKDLKEWAEKLKKKDRYKMTKEQVIEHAEKMGVKFEDYDELEFYVTFLAMLSDYDDISSDPTIFIKMAKDFLDDDDIKVSPSEKLCIYLYKIVKGE